MASPFMNFKALHLLNTSFGFKQGVPRPTSKMNKGQTILYLSFTSLKS